MIELEPAAEHRVPLDAVESLADLIIVAQWGDDGLQNYRLIRAWSQIKEYDAAKGFTPTKGQAIRWLVGASQIAQSEWFNGELVAQLVGESHAKPFSKLILPSIIDVGPEILPYLEPFYRTG
jgi:hypothetical protein